MPFHHFHCLVFFPFQTAALHRDGENSTLKERKLFEVWILFFTEKKYYEMAKILGGSQVKRFDIIFDSPSGAFYSGQIVSGKVVIDLTESMKVRCK